jgi:outer membrane protein assembly factor BamB
VALPSYTQAQISPGLLTAVGPGEGSTDAKWSLDAWALPSGVKQWSRPASETTRLGGVWKGYYYFGDAAGIHRLPLPPGDPPGEQIREFPGMVPWPQVAGGRVYFNVAGHEICGLDATDLQRGWRAYCDGGAEFADADGVYGTGTVGFGLVVLRPDGQRAWIANDGLPSPPSRQPAGATGAEDQYFRQFVRGDFTVAGNALVIGGQEAVHLQRSDKIHVLSPYLYAFRKRTGKLLWKKPMIAAHPVLLPGKVLVWAGHRRDKGPDLSLYGVAAAGGLDWRLEAYDLETGRRLWRGSRRRDIPPGLVASGDRYFVLENGRLTCYR